MGRTSDARARLVDAAQSLIHANGYQAVGVSDICRAAGVNKGSFYHFFPSKQALGLAVVDAYRARALDQMSEAVAGTAPLSEKLGRLFEGIRGAQSAAKKEQNCAPGCLLGNLGLELSHQDLAIQARLQEVFSAQRDLLADAIERAVADGSCAATEPKRTAEAVLSYLQGTVMMAKLYNKPKRIDKALAFACRLAGAIDPATSVSGTSQTA